MDPEALIGKQTGTSTLQHLIGSGTLGAVYLGQQAQPARQVAVKVFLRLASLELQQQRAFLATFRDEMARVFALDHPHILPVYDYGDVDGLAYIVMPYIIGETLEDLLAHERTLPLQVVASFLRQIAAALDYAHEHGIVHRDLKPANIFITPDKKVWVADFHLTAMLVEGNTAHIRLSKPGLLDYMSPELIVGKQIDKRADLYSLGALVYRMVTGTPLFQGQTLMKVATKHLKMPPPSPRAVCPDLPSAAEQVILKALAKDPAWRFDSASDMGLLFQQAIDSATAPHITSHPASPLPSVGTRLIASTPSASAQSMPGSLAFDRSASGQFAPANFMPGGSLPGNRETASAARLADSVVEHSQPAGTESTSTGPYPFLRPPLFGSGWPMNGMPAITAGQSSESSGAINVPRPRIPVEPAGSSSALLPPYDAFNVQNGQSSTRTTSQNLALTHNAVQANPLTPAAQVPAQESMASGSITWALPEIKQGESGITGTYKLTGPARIVSIPVAGQPGRYMTGILPSAQQSAETDTLYTRGQRPVQHSLLRRLRLPIFVLAALLIVGGTLGFAFLHFASSKHPGGPTISTAGTPNFSATASAQAQASAEAKIILSDPLSRNIRSWPEDSNGPFLYRFEDGAYHITNNDSSRVAIAILPGENLNRPFVYTLTMDEIHGDDTSVNNEFGMVLRFNSQTTNGKPIVTFYSFEVVNEKEGQYQFWKYDNSQGPSANPWKQLATHPFGSEFHQGQGPAHSNTFQILVNGKNFTLIVNGKHVWTVQDSSLTSGQVGMLVNLKGTEVAFSNLMLTWS